MTGRRTHGFAVVTIFVASIGVASLSGCLQEVPIVSNEAENKTTNMTLDEQREWVGMQLAEGVAASGVSEGWFNTRRTIPWSDTQEDRDGVLNMLFPRDCDLGGRLVVSLKNTDAIEPLVAAEKVRANWESEGWTVTDVRADAENRDPYFRADREDGAVLAFQASDEGMSLSVESACSVNNSVTNWQSYVEDEPNEFEKELERRAQEGG